jgi:exonuclease III
MCTWPRFPHDARRFYKILRRVLTADKFELISRVHDVVQRSDGRFRLDIWIDNRTHEAHQVAATIQEQLPHRWHTRMHIPYHNRRARDRGLRIANRSNTQPRGLTVASWNIRSFWPKKDSILWLLQKNNVDIFAIQETWCNVDSWAPKLSGYTVHSVPSGSRGEVGLALAVRSHLTSSVLEKTSHWIIAELRMENGVFIVANIYFPSGGLNHTVIRDFDHALDRYAANIARSRIVIMGDFNRLPEEVDQLCWRWSAPVTRLITRGSPGTFHGYRPQMEPSAIDHILFGPSLQTQTSVKVLRGWSDSDHWPIITTFPPHLGELPRPVPKKVYSRTFSDSQRINFSHDNRWDVLVDQLSGDTSVDAATSHLLETFTNVGNASGRIVETIGPSVRRPNLSHKSRCAIRHRTQALNNFLSTGSDAARSEFFQLKDETRRCLKLDAKKRWERRLEQLREAVGSRNNKRAWSWINGFMKPPRLIQGSLLPAIYDESGTLQTSERAKEAAWLAYYRRLFDDLSGHSRDPSWWTQFRPNIGSPQLIDPLSSPISVPELLRLLGKLKNGK